MEFLMKNNRDTQSLHLNLHPKLDAFFIAHATVKNGEIITYITNHQQWFHEFPKNWKDDPIVAVTPPVREKLRLLEWGFPIKKPEHRSFYELRYNITGADSGFTVFKSSLHDQDITSEFYALGSREESSFSQSMIIDPIFVKQAFRSIIYHLKAIS